MTTQKAIQLSTSNSQNELTFLIDKIKNEEYELLKKEIGDDVFRRLNHNQRDFILNISGSIKLGDEIDVERLSGYLSA